MNKKRIRVLHVATVIASGLVGVQQSHIAHAAFIYTGLDAATPFAWSDKTNWNNGSGAAAAVPGGSNVVLFQDPVGTNINLSGTTIVDASNSSVLQLDLGDNSGDTLNQTFNINTSGGKTISLAINGNNTSGAPTGLLRAAAATGTQTINADLLLGQTQIWNVGGTSGSLVVKGTINQSTGVVAGLTKSSGGILELAGSNSFSGPAVVQGGTLVLDNAQGLGTDLVDPVQLNAAASSSNASLLLNNNINFNRSIAAILNATVGGKNDTIGGASSLVGTATFSGPGITLYQGLQVDVLANDTIDIESPISDGVGTTGNTVAKINGGTVILGLANSFSGGYTARGGTTIVANNQSLGTSVTALVSGVSATSTAALLTNAGVTLPQNITIQANVSSGGISGQYGATIGGAAGQANSVWVGSVVINQPINITGNVTFAGNLVDGVGGNNSTGVVYSFNGSNITKTDSGTVTFSGSNTYSGSTNISGGKLILASAHAVPVGNNLTIGPAASVVASKSVSPVAFTIGSLSVSGLLDLNNNALVVQNSSLQAVNSLVAAGAVNASTGIISSTALADTTHLTTIGVISNSTGTATFDGATTNLGDVLVKYTYYGDANLDGIVDSSDYSRIDSGYITKATGWYNGDFNGDGVIDGSDYTLIDNAFNTQGANLTAVIATPTSEVAAVPEPTSSLVLATTAIALLGRRKRGLK